MISGYVDISQVIYEACERLGISNSEAYEMRFMRLILTAEKKIATGLISSKKITLYEPGNVNFLDGKKLILPHDLTSHLSILDSTDNEIQISDYSLVGKRIVFNDVRTSSVVLEYIGVEFDVNDEPVISSNHEEAVVSYLVYMENFTRYQSKKIPKYIFDDSREWWQDRLGEARGDDAFPDSDGIKKASEEYSCVKMCLLNGEVISNGSNNVAALIIEYTNLSQIYYGILPLADQITVATDYTNTILSNQVESTVGALSSDTFILTTLTVGRLVIVVPYASGLIKFITDAGNNNILDQSFNILKDETKQLTIYVAIEFIIPGDYKLTFGFN